MMVVILFVNLLFVSAKMDPISFWGRENFPDDIVNNSKTYDMQDWVKNSDSEHEQFCYNCCKVPTLPPGGCDRNIFISSFIDKTCNVIASNLLQNWNSFNTNASCSTLCAVPNLDKKYAPPKIHIPCKPQPQENFYTSTLLFGIFGSNNFLKNLIQTPYERMISQSKENLKNLSKLLGQQEMDENLTLLQNWSRNAPLYLVHRSNEITSNMLDGQLIPKIFEGLDEDVDDPFSPYFRNEHNIYHAYANVFATAAGPFGRKMYGNEIVFHLKVSENLKKTSQWWGSTAAGDGFSKNYMDNYCNKFNFRIPIVRKIALSIVSKTTNHFHDLCNCNDRRCSKNESTFREALRIRTDIRDDMRKEFKKIIFGSDEWKETLAIMASKGYIGTSNVSRKWIKFQEDIKILRSFGQNYHDPKAVRHWYNMVNFRRGYGLGYMEVKHEGPVELEEIERILIVKEEKFKEFCSSLLKKGTTKSLAVRAKVYLMPSGDEEEGNFLFDENELQSCAQE